MIILPTNDPRKARELLNQEIANKYTITMLVLGDGNGMEQIVNDADICASHLPGVRHVVWVKDTSFLDAEELKNYRNGNSSTIVCGLNLHDKPVVFLDRAKAEDILELEKAFFAAQQG